MHGDTVLDGAGVTAQSSARRLLAADVGGTYARLGLVDPDGDGFSVGFHRRYECAAFPSLAAVLRRFRDEAVGAGETAFPDACVVAIAGVLQGDHLLNGNLAWPVSLSATRRDAGIGHLHLINDFEALAWALPRIPQAQLQPLGAAGGLPLPTLLLGPGTGLGAALLVEQDGRPAVQPSEAGQAALAAGTPLELEVVRLLQARFGHVASERVFSGPGLVNLYLALCALREMQPRWQTPAELVEAADQGSDPLAAECIALFCGWLGSFAGDLALTFRAGSVCLAGGLTGHLQRHLGRGDFIRRFLDKGVLSDSLREVPVHALEHGDLGLIGAAAWHAARPRD
ncbi:glucokinase [Thermomonas fusca]|uniref:Glucokinase n=1 Tax=Thermomonas fusca TaxID=215690 RepID=A0A5R9PGB6_9GAMM|nr:glucokinase [Thermomonas fusca]TLX21650.1 glucokinase [Thermomonas fusca]